MRTILRCQALLSRKLMRPMSCNSLRHTRTAFSGPPPTEPAFEDFKPFSGGWNYQPREEIVPKEADLAIVGGGLVGLCTAFFIKHRFPRSFSVVIIEKDPLYSHSSSALSVCGIRHQYSLEEHVKMSLFASEFLCDIEDYLTLRDIEPPDVHFNPQGYLLLSSADEAELMEHDHKMQTVAGANVELMSPSDLKKKFPWLSVDDVKLASYGLEREGWFDPTLLIAAVKAKLASCGVSFVTGEVVGFNWCTDRVGSGAGVVEQRDRLNRVHVRTAAGHVHPMQFGVFLDAAGAESRRIARLAGIGVGEKSLAIDLPIMSRNNFVYLLHCASGPGIDMPMMLDVSGFFLRREGLRGNYVCSAIPPLTPSGMNDDALDPIRYFTDVVRPLILRRIPGMEQLELVSCWTRQMDYNYFDRCPIVGNHPYHRNFMMAAGSVGHGAQFAPALGRYLNELTLDGDYRTIDLSRLTFDRVLDDDPIYERLVI